MKYLIAILTLASSHAFACSPALPATAQLISLNRILSSQAFKAEMSAAQGRDYSVRITNISASGTEITLSNGCTIKSSTTFKPAPSPGMCPQVEAVVSETICQ